MWPGVKKFEDVFTEITQFQIMKREWENKGNREIPSTVIFKKKRIPIVGEVDVKEKGVGNQRSNIN